MKVLTTSITAVVLFAGVASATLDNIGDNSTSNTGSIEDSSSYTDTSVSTYHSNTVNEATDLSKQVGNHTTTNLTTSGNDTCFGSVSGGVSGAGFGISSGKTYVDENCVMIKKVKLLQSIGLNDAAVLLMIQTDPDLAEAILGAYPALHDKFGVALAIHSAKEAIK